MFRCAKCHQPTKGSPIRVPTGFKRGPDRAPTQQRLGEANLCSRCALLYKLTLEDIVEVRGGYKFKYLMEPVKDERTAS